MRIRIVLCAFVRGKAQSLPTPHFARRGGLQVFCGFCAVRAAWKKDCVARSGLQKLLFFYTVSAGVLQTGSSSFRACRHPPQTPFIIAKDDSWKKARKARLA
jgi:hypothetical protein